MSNPEQPIQQRDVTTTIAPEPMAAPVGAVATDVPVAAGAVYAPPVAAAQVSTTSARRFSPDAVVAGLAGLAMLIIGLIVVIRAGLDAPLSTPVVEVLGFTHTATLGLVEVGVGLFLLIAAAARSRGAETFGGLAMVVAGVVGVVQYQSFDQTLALERGWAWVVLIAGVVVAAAALLLPRVGRRSTVVRQVVA